MEPSTDTGLPTPPKAADFGVKSMPEGAERPEPYDPGEDQAPAPHFDEEQDREGVALQELKRRGIHYVDQDAWKAKHNGSLDGWRTPSQVLDFRNQVDSVFKREREATDARLQDALAKVAILEAKDRQREQAQQDAVRTVELSQLEAEWQQAADAGDTARQREINSKIIAHTVNAELAKRVQQQTPQVDPVAAAAIKDFAAVPENEIFYGPTKPEIAKDFTLNVKLVRESGAHDGTARDVLEQAKRRTMREHPEQFSRPAVPYMGDSGGNATGRGFNGNGYRNWRYENLKPEYREFAEKYARSGLTKEAYMANILKDKDPAQYFNN